VEVAEAEASVRLGDIYALAVETHARGCDWAAALRLCRDMSARGIPLAPYLDPALLSQVFRENGEAWEEGVSRRGEGEVGEEESAGGFGVAEVDDDYRAYARC